MVEFYLKRIIQSPIFWVSVIALAVLMVIGCVEDLGAASQNLITILYCFQITNSIGISHVLLPAVVVIPFLFFYVDELEKGAMYYQLIRGGKDRSYRGQISAALLSAALITLLAVFLFFFVCVILGAKWQANDSLIMSFSNTYYEEMIQNKIYLVYIIYVLVFVCYSTPWTLMGVVISLFTKNRYLILIGPFIIFMAVSYLTELSGMLVLHPGYTLLKGITRTWGGGGLYYAIGYHFFLNTILSIWYLIMCRRRFRCEGI